jgi:hypothetical protein
MALKKKVLLREKYRVIELAVEVCEFCRNFFIGNETKQARYVSIVC